MKFPNPVPFDPDEFFLITDHWSAHCLSALPQSCSGLARHPASLRPFQTDSSGLNSVGTDGHPQSAVSCRPDSEGQATASLLRQSRC